MKNPARDERLSLEQMLEQEYEFLHPELAHRSQSVAAQPQGGPISSGATCLEQRLLERNASALCLSGGGIRSATFCLGALQALAASGKLKTFTYLSTVSGGGYVGSWLSRWVRQADGDLEAVEQQLAGGKSDRDREEAPQVAELRAYSNYLSPVWGLSVDFFTLVSIVLRNLLLNWCVLLPLIGAAALLPHFYLDLITRDLSTLKDWSLGLLSLAGLGCGLVALTYVASDLPALGDSGQAKPGSGATGPCRTGLLACLLGRDPGKDYFPSRVFVPVFAFVLICSVLLAWIELPHIGLFAAAGVVLHLASAMLARYCMRSRADNAQVQEKTSVVLLRALVVGLVSGMVAYLLCWLLKQLPQTPELNRKLHAVFALPMTLFVLWLGTTGFVAVVRGSSSEAMREWWARSGGWWLAASLFWLSWFLLILLLPQWLLGSQFVKDLLSEYKMPLAVGGGLWGLLTGLMGYWSKHATTMTSRARKIADLIGVRLLELAAIVFIVVVLLAMSLGWESTLKKQAWSTLTSGCDLWYCQGVKHVIAVPGLLAGLVLAALLLFAFVSSALVGVNTFSLHGMYGNRLVRAYLGAARAGVKRHPHPFTGFDNDDNIGMGEIAEQQRQASSGKGAEPRLFHVLNLTLNLLAASGNRLEWQQRKAASFSVSPLHAGCAELAYVDSQRYGSGQQRGISLGRAMTISGAAASPNMGYHSSVAVTFVMTLFNVRLGWWQPNPGRGDGSSWAKGEPGWRSLGLLIAEALGQTRASSSHVYLSDGGHFENLGLYEMVRRRCKTIWVFDASADPAYEYEDLENAIRKIRVDFGISIEFKPDSFAAPTHLALATIHYGEQADQKGQLYYIKPVLTDDLPLDVIRYAEASRASDGKNPFPHQSTADQFFDEAQFESYRMLGRHLTRKALERVEVEHQGLPATRFPEPGEPADRPDGKLASLIESAPGLGKAALLASALTIGGVVGVGGTIALERASVEIKPGSTIEISQDSLDELRWSGRTTERALGLAAWEIKRIADKLVALQSAGDGAATQQMVKSLGAIERRLDLLAQAVASNHQAFAVPVAGMARSLARLESEVVALKAALDDRKASAALLERLDATLRRVETAVQDATPRRNIHGVEGSDR